MKVAPRLSNDNFAELTDTLDWNQNFVKQLLMNVEFDCFVGYLVKTFSEFHSGVLRDVTKEKLSIEPMDRLAVCLLASKD